VNGYREEMHWRTRTWGQQLSNAPAIEVPNGPFVALNDGNGKEEPPQWVIGYLLRIRELADDLGVLGDGVRFALGEILRGRAFALGNLSAEKADEWNRRSPGKNPGRHWTGRAVFKPIPIGLIESVRREVAGVANLKTVSTAVAVSDHATAPVEHSPDFRSVRWYGNDYSFSGNQAVIVESLWDAWTKGTPDISDAKLLAKAGADTKRIADVFRRKGAAHPAWGTMIVTGDTKGTRRLVPTRK
jgi:hypothetical protein